LKENKIKYIDERLGKKNRSKFLKQGDILNVRTGANLGDTAVVPRSLEGAQCFTLLISTVKEKFNPNYFCYFINSESCQKYFGAVSLGSAQSNLSVSILQELPIIEPSIEEQNLITEFLKNKLVQYNVSIEKINSQIQKLQEFRQSLISSAVTGKIDVTSLA